MKTTGLDDDIDVEALSESALLQPQPQQQGQDAERGRAPPGRQLSQSDSDADRVGEELLSLANEDDVHDWIKRSLNLLPPLHEMYGEDDEGQDGLGTAGGPVDDVNSSAPVAGLLSPVSEGTEDGAIAEDFVSQIRRTRSASAGQPYAQSHRPPLKFSGAAAASVRKLTSQSVRFGGISPYGHSVAVGGGGGSISGGLRRVTTYGGPGMATSTRFGYAPSLRVSGMGTERIHLAPQKDSVRVPSGFYGDWGAKGRGGVLMKVGCMAAIASVVLVGLLAGVFYMGQKLVGPPRQPVGAYQLVELQEGDAFWDYYNFYVGSDSIGSNGYLQYVSKDRAFELSIANVTTEGIPADEEKSAPGIKQASLNLVGVGTDSEQYVDPEGDASDNPSQSMFTNGDDETFVYMKSAPTKEGPRESIRLEGKRRFHRGLFILDLRHMPTGCGVWPAFWLTDEANWPVNGEIDIVEGVNFQSTAKTALHSTQVCKMDDVPLGTKTGSWDDATGVPDAKTGKPSMAIREATNCYVYDPHQWLNQGCVAVDEDGDSLGQPLNDNGGGVYALDWDPINRHIRTFVFTPHNKVPQNLVDTIRTAGGPDEERVAPDPGQWGLPYGYFPIGEATNCPASHFRNMRLVFNLAFCGSVSGNRYNMDCPKQAKKYKTCNDWIKADPIELEEAYW
eukprot:CAMPEP_0178522318 /NCGR_PEP_ID=MMETSP0696-20121128/28470_1 /TAXON_ID=265572 /ORGANISM="Extubocellulus spinifer, Strain CCMP396" /LENGTH=673 /DNA_ID=CAMNT_0020153427 /DNA_START=123 /DNA_END=2141 /DNA_ORIENTATION=+